MILQDCSNLYRSKFKRLLDLFTSCLLLILLFPLWITVAVLIKMESSGPIFFVQERLGFKGEVFPLFKFRSMIVNQSRNEQQVLPGNPEITRIGRFLRRFKIDETPQIINVLLGHMSIIGPRPCLPELRQQFDENGEKRLAVRPGLSGWAQINGNIYNSWEIRWKYDAYYVNNLSLWFDLRIFLETFLVIIFGEKKR